MIETDSVKINRILPQDGDSIISFGSHTVYLNTFANRISWSLIRYWPCNITGLSIGNGDNVLALGENSIAVGSNTRTDCDASNSIVMGSGIGGTLLNNIANSFMVGYGISPTLYVDGTSVGIGTTSPNVQLEITENFRLPKTFNVSGVMEGVIYSDGNSYIHNYGDNNFFAGVSAGNFTMVGEYNVGIGVLALERNTIGTSNTANGFSALNYNREGSNNTALGAKAMQKNITGDNNTAIGNESLINNDCGNFNTATGVYALSSNAKGSNNTATGANALASYNPSIILEGNNTATGVNALTTNIEGNNNTATGANSLYANENGSNNTAIGANALYSYNPTTIIDGNNTATGANALYSNTEGNYNTATGEGALFSNELGLHNTATGNRALYSNKPDNLLNCGQLYMCGSGNSAYGVEALANNIDGSENVAIGVIAGWRNITGSRNTFIGNAAGLNNTVDGNYNTFLGFLAQANGDYDYATAIGARAIVEHPNSIELGIVGTTIYTPTNTAIQVGSDSRFKKNVQENVKGLEFIKKLRPVTFNFDTKKLDDFTIKNMPDSIKEMHQEGMDFTTSSSIVHSGFIAQEVEQAANDCGFTSSIVDVPADTSTGVYSLGYTEIVVPLVKAVQELSDTIDSLKSKQKILDSLQTTTVDSLKNIVAGYETRFDTLEAMIIRCCEQNSKIIQGNNVINQHRIELANAIVLNQNVPNPFAESTTISYYIPDYINYAQIIFTDNAGKIIRTVDLNEKGNGMLNVYANNLSSGMYSYSIIVDGKVVDTKKMVCSK